MSEKTEKPTHRKLQDARKRGEVYKSTELTSTVVFVALMLLLSFLAPRFLRQIDVYFSQFFRHIPRASESPTQIFAAYSAGQSLFESMLFPILATCVATAVLTVFLQVRPVFSLDPIKPKPERLNPATNLKNLFSSKTIITLAKHLVQSIIIGVVVITVVRGRASDIARSIDASPKQVLYLLADLLQGLCIIVFAVYVFMSAVDYAHQFYEYLKQQKMSKDEVLREYKDIEGDPHIKSHRKALHRSLSQEQAVKKANVVITNPTHIAVALRYVPGEGELPTVVAKGVDAIAKQIREQARAAGIPIIENKPLARRLHAQVEVNRFIGSDLFAEVAKVFAQLPSAARGSAGGTRLRV
jgi:type III secretion YscU/HrpY family protein